MVDFELVEERARRDKGDRADRAVGGGDRGGVVDIKPQPQDVEGVDRDDGGHQDGGS
jgi:hypothetical protein